ncbi:ABC transporter permease [Paracoccus aminophilus]|nr:ABC transporter permease [Paracoccus aminophilus]
MPAELHPAKALPRRRSAALQAIAGLGLSAQIGLAIIALYALVAIFAPLIAPFGEAQIVGRPYQAWAAPTYLGTDQLGRDLLSRLIYGARNTIGIALATTALAFAVGMAAGIYSALRSGWRDQLISRLADILLSMPSLIFSLLLLTVFGASAVNLVLILALLDSAKVFRVARASARDVAVMDFIEVARLRGDSGLRIMTREILPNILPTVVAEFGLRFCFVFLAISGLSFLGVGLQPPTADWGSMVRENASLISRGQITPILPAICIAVLTLAVNYVADGWLENRAGGSR